MIIKINNLEDEKSFFELLFEIKKLENIIQKQEKKIIKLEKKILELEFKNKDFNLDNIYEFDVDFFEINEEEYQNYIEHVVAQEDYK